MPAKMMGVSADVVEGVVRGANPWIEFWSSSIHGYGVLTLTPDQLVCELKAVTTIREPVADVVLLRTFMVPVNEVKLNS